MKQLSLLIILINTLSKAEKRHFRMTANLQAGDKKYVYLFDLIESNYPADEIYTLFNKKYQGSSFEMTVKHLYRSIMDCLIYLRRKRDIQAKMFAMLSEADILFERGLYDEAFAALDKVKKVSSIYELDTLTLMARRNELKYLNILDFRNINERQLIGKQIKIVELIKSIRSSYLHSQLYDILKHRLFHKGYVHSEKQKKDLDDLVLSELNIVGNDSKESFETQKLHLLFQSAYYLDSGNYKMAVRFYRTLIELFEANRHLILNPPVYYLQALTGILNSLQASGLYDEMPFFIQKMEDILQGNYPDDFMLSVHALIFLYQFARFFNTGNYISATNLIAEQEEILFKKLSLLQLDMQLSLLLTLVRLNIATNNYEDARKSMKKITASGKLFYALPTYRYARLLNLILQTELKNYDFLENEIKSIKRNIHYEKHLYITEKLLFKFIMRYTSSTGQKMREQLLKQIRKERLKIMQNKYEQQLLSFFDFISWMESKLNYS